MNTVRHIFIGFALVFVCVISNGQERVVPQRKSEQFELAYILQMLEESFVYSFQASKFSNYSINDVLKEVDSDSGYYFSPLEYENWKKNSGSNFASVGLTVTSSSGALVLKPDVAGPAALAGLKDGDKLLEVDGKSSSQMTGYEANFRLMGAEGTSVAVLVSRAGSLEMLSVTLKRVFPTRQKVVFEMQGDALVMRMPQVIDEVVLEETAKQIVQQWQRAPFKKVVLDLRKSWGGLLTSVVGIASIFLPQDSIIVKTVGKTAAANQTLRATQSDYSRNPLKDPLSKIPNELKVLPLAVLIDERSLAGAEFIAAALATHQRAVLLGRTTAGKGSVQTLRPTLSGGAVIFTTAYALSPNDKAIQGVGVAPMISLRAAEDDSATEVAIQHLNDQAQGNRCALVSC